MEHSYIVATPNRNEASAHSPAVCGGHGERTRAARSNSFDDIARAAAVDYAS